VLGGDGASLPGVATAVVLAAGSGTRLRGLHAGLPKGLLEIGGVPLVQRSLETLLDCGLRRVVLVAGFRADAYRRFLGSRFPDVEVCLNPDHHRTGSMRSLYEARNRLSGDFLLVESDLLYEPRAVTELLCRPAGDWLLLSGATGQGDEVYAHGAPGRLGLLSKARHAGLALQGEFVGISRLTPALLQAMCRHHEACSDARPRLEYDDCLSELSATRPVGLHLVEDLVWAEIDDPSQHRRAVERVLPALARRAIADARPA
jgi:choline kinase